MSIEQYFSTPCEHYRYEAPDGSWGSEASRAYQGRFFGWLQPGSGKLITQDGKPAAEATHLLFAPLEADLAPRDELEIHGRLFTVLHVRNAAGMDHHKEIDLKERY